MDTERQGMSVVRLAAWGGVLGPIVFVALVIVGGAITDGYSHVTQKISELGATGAQHALLQNLNFALLGISVVGFAWALGRTLGRPLSGPALIGFFGVVVFVHSFLSCDAGCNGETTAGLLHNVTGLMGFVAAIAGMIVLARRWANDPDWRSLVTFTRSAVAVAIAGLASFVATQALDIQTFAGVAQRTFAGALLLWITVTSAHLVRATTGPGAPHHEAHIQDTLTKPI